MAVYRGALAREMLLPFGSGGWSLAKLYIIEQAHKLLLDAVKRIGIPTGRVDARPQPLDMGEDSLEAGLDHIPRSASVIIA